MKSPLPIARNILDSAWRVVSLALAALLLARMSVVYSAEFHVTIDDMDSSADTQAA